MSTDVGRVRKSNQDAVLHFALSDEDGQPGCYAAVLADGMGGHAAGEIASRIAVDTLRRVLTTNSAGPAARLAKSFAEFPREGKRRLMKREAALCARCC